MIVLCPFVSFSHKQNLNGPKEIQRPKYKIVNAIICLCFLLLEQIGQLVLTHAHRHMIVIESLYILLKRES